MNTIFSGKKKVDKYLKPRRCVTLQQASDIDSFKARQRTECGARGSVAGVATGLKTGGQGEAQLQQAKVGLGGEAGRVSATAMKFMGW